MSKIALILIVTSILSSARSQTWSGPNQLQPVHGLYVKPSSDGTTGDLYVAATEDSGTKAQWLTDQPVNFLPSPAQAFVPLAFPSFPAHEEGSGTQKRAIMSPPVAPVQYAYAVPFNPTEGAQPQYPYPIATPETQASPCDTASPAIPYPYQFFYPQMMQASLQAYANAKNLLKESTGLTDEKAGSVIPQASPFWPTSYSYSPYPMYVMMNPSAWAQTQPAQDSSNAATVESSPK